MNASTQPRIVVLAPVQPELLPTIIQKIKSEASLAQYIILTITHQDYLALKNQLPLLPLPSESGRIAGSIYYLLAAKEQLLAHAVTQAIGQKDRQIQYLGNELGFFTANPSILTSAKLIKYLDYREAKEMMLAMSGEIGASDIELLEKNAIVFHYQSLQSSNSHGTIISNRSETDAPQIKMLTLKQDVTTVSLSTSAMAGRAGFMAQVFACFSALNLSIDHIATSEDQITLTIDSASKEALEKSLGELHQLLSPLGEVKIQSARCALSLIGNKVKSSWHKIASIFSLFEEHPIYLMSYSAADVNLTLVLDSNQAIRLMKALHAELIEGDIINPIFGQSWAQLQQTADSKQETGVNMPWWYQRRDELVELAKKSETALYVYNLPTVEERAQQLKLLRSIDHILFAIKANNNPDILKVVESAGHGFECVSLQEVEHVLKNFPQIDRKRILFTPNFSPKTEYQAALKLGVNLTLDSTFPLEQWPEIFNEQEIFVRIDTGIGKGHHHYVHTAGNLSKFGVPPQEMEKLLTLCHQHHVKIVGLHAHAGSGILTPDAWSKVGAYLFAILPQFPHVKTIDLGGGLGVPEKIGQDSLALEQVENTLEIFKKNAPHIRLWMEPGRFFVAEAGIILAQVTQVKKKGDVQYVGINTGMNSLIRPALYGAHHEIKNISRLFDQDNYQANVVGPICESGDVLGHSRPLPRATQSGDIILIGNAGAYGRVMSSHYTMRAPAIEVTLNHRRNEA